MQNATQHSLNDLTIAVTAFRSWNEFAEKLNNGYTPTLMENKLSTTKREQARNELVRELADRLESLGWKVWRGSNC